MSSTGRSATRPAGPLVAVHAARVKPLWRALAAAVLLLVVVGFPVLLARSVGWPLPRTTPTVSQLHDAATGVLAGGIVVKILACGAWLAWAHFLLCVLAEVRGEVTGRQPRVPFGGISQQLAHRLVVTTLVAGAVTGTAGLTPAQALATPRPTVSVSVAGQGSPAAGALGRSSEVVGAAAVWTATRGMVAEPAGRAVEQGRLVYVVQAPHRGYVDNLWDIAERHLGNGTRWREIFTLNRGRPQADGRGLSDPDLVRVGWRLHMPADATGLPEQQPPPDANAAAGTVSHTVRAGETLRSIADRLLGDEARAAELFAANRGRIQPGGEHLTDPDFIRPGWKLIVPGHGREAGRPASPAQASPGAPAGPEPVPAAGPAAVKPAGPAQPAQPTATPTRTADRPDHEYVSPATHDASAPWGELFAGFGAVLAAGLLGGLVVRRRMSWRTARIGHTIAATPPHLAPAEKAILMHSSMGASDGQFLDFALRSLVYATAGTEGAALPDVRAARMTGDELQLRLAESHPANPPAPWRADESGLWWSIPVGVDLPISADNACDVAAPYPTLVGVGYVGADTAEEPDEPVTSREKWLVDLERAGAVALTGDAQRCLDLSRFIAAGLAVNDWSDQVTVTMVGFGAELVPINPSRMRYTDDLDAAAALLQADYGHSCTASANAGTGVLDARAHGVSLDSFMPHVLLVAPHVAAEQGRLGELLGQLADRPGRATVAIVLAGERADVPAAGWVLHVTADGHIALPRLGLNLLAQRLPREQAEGIAELLHRAGAEQEQPVPPASGSRQWEQFCDAAGSLRPEFTLPRTPAASAGPVPVTVVSGPADLIRPDRSGTVEATTTMLPAEDDAYLQAAATTGEDLGVVAPRVPAEVTARVAESVSGLDESLAAWRDPDCPLPRLTLLGPVELRAHGQVPQRIAYYTEVAAYLTSRDHGAQIDQVADAFDVKNATAASRLQTLRAWLGVNPRTGEVHLPDARKSKASRCGVSVYEIEDLLVDADLFQQLYLRGQARGGVEGIADLEAALELVIGEPYSQRRSGGYAWLRDNPVDEYLNVAVEKVAHTVASWGLEQCEPDRAEHAARTALKAMPYAEVPRLDLAAVLEARGLKEAAERLLRDEVCNRDDDGNGPLDLSDRTEQIRRRREWLSAS